MSESTGSVKNSFDCESFKKGIYGVTKCNLPQKKRKIANMEGSASIIKT